MKPKSNTKPKPKIATLNTQAAADLLNAHVETIRRLARRGAIPAFKVGKDWRFHRDALLSWSKTASLETLAPPARVSPQVGKPRAAEMPLPTRRHGSAFPIVGIGASAGGLEALELFISHVRQNSGMAFIVVQHLDPTHKGMLAELLQRNTSMEVLQIKDRQQVAPNRVYVIPPNYDLSILHGVLHLLAPTAPRGLRLPIDFFFRALAADQQARSLGVILSGMGSDGTLGLRAIKEQGGATFVQAPASAKFDAMPRSAINAEVADVVVPVEELPGKISAYRAHVPAGIGTDQTLAPKTQSAIEKICILLRNQTGHDFSQYKRSTIYRRIERRMGLHQIDGIDSYVKYLQESPQETLLLFKELLIGVTNFFRDPTVWEQLKKTLSAALTKRTSGGVMRAWVAGCSTGEEAYSLAMIFKEILAEARPPRSVSLQIFATDLDKDSIERARQGVYPANIAADVTPERLQRFFVPDERGYRVSQEIRETVVFAIQNLIMDPPFTKLDLISCRNLLIYLAPEVQKKLLPLFHYSLNPGGILFLGNAEALGTSAGLFAHVTGKLRIYRRLEVVSHGEPIEFPTAFQIRPVQSETPGTSKAPVINLQAQADQFLLEYFAPAAVLTTAQGDILYVSGHTGKYLEPAAGKSNWNVHAMARAGLRRELHSAFPKALRQRPRPVKTRVKLQQHGTAQQVDITVEALNLPEALRGMILVVFADVTDSPGVKNKKGAGLPLAAAQRELLLQQSQEELLSTREQMQTSQEELKSANEELQSSNEELQSTNEELTTSKEEMQSLNEELQTLNHELQAKLDELTHANDDMRNLLDSTDIATLFLDDALRVRRFTAPMTKLIKLIPGDVNRPITDLASDLDYPALAEDARSVLQTLVFKERPVQALDGRWFSVRIMPYRTLDNRIDGVVITFVDITAAKTLEATLRQTPPGTEA
ncbi:MAG: helix-turn-helix domain-containing protein [Candidatus Firestonebacteria bacterium]|nr:helix-turn-helix domain-containing protein [Candidatus Firestonebacteria bacterium]